MPLKKVSLKLKTYHTRRLTLRTLTTKDYMAWMESQTQKTKSQTKWDSGPKQKQDCSKAKFLKLLRRLKELSRNDDYYRMYIFHKRSGRIVGEIDFDIYVRSTHQFSNFGYQIYNSHWGKGFGQEAAKMGLTIGFKDLQLNRLEAAINLDNQKSIHLAKAIGMKREGIKKRYWFEHGKWTDHLIYVANPEDIGLKAQKPYIKY